MRRIILFLSILLTTGCAIEPQRPRAFVPCYCKAGPPPDNDIQLWVPDDDYTFNIHQYSFQEGHLTFEIHLPRRPANSDTFNAAEIRMVQDLGYTEKSVGIVSGTVSIDYSISVVVVNLATSDGPFLGNGKYDLLVEHWR
jgi:hypothetical protein